MGLRSGRYITNGVTSFVYETLVVLVAKSFKAVVNDEINFTSLLQVFSTGTNELDTFILGKYRRLIGLLLSVPLSPS